MRVSSMRNVSRCGSQRVATRSGGRAWELRGVMRVEDRRGYLLADTVCELGRNGRVRDFAFLRSD